MLISILGLSKRIDIHTAKNKNDNSSQKVKVMHMGRERFAEWGFLTRLAGALCLVAPFWGLVFFG